MTQKTVQLLFDYASPWAYLASSIVSRRLAGANVEPVPVYLRGFETFARGLPYGAAKLQYQMHDLRRCTQHEGVAVTLPQVFPINGLYALRGAIAAQREGSFRVYHDAMFRAAWHDGLNVGDKAVVAGLAREWGLPSVAEALDDPTVKDALRTNTESAVQRGVFGVPTFFVGEEMFWGHDRIDYVARALGLTSSV
jgi:2-hydroxychromene-2-carboxylate isomerase